MPAYPTQFFSQPFAADGDKTIIGDTSVTTGRANLPEGFPPETSLPIAQGGIAPNRLDFNGILFMLSSMLCWEQSGGMWLYNSQLDYVPPAIAFHGGKYWQCVQANGKAFPITPGSNVAYWMPLPQFLNQNNAYPVRLTGDAEGTSQAGKDGLTIDVTVNQASKLTNARTITFGGDVTGAFTFDGSGNVNVTLTSNMKDGNPVGTVIMYWGNSAPSGYFACNGGTFDGDTYPKLRTVLGGTTLPDLRNRFIRGASPGPRNTGVQENDAGRNITGTFTSEALFLGSLNSIPPSGAFYIETESTSSRHISSKGEGSGQNMGFDASRSWGTGHTAAEFRPMNTAVLFCIKHD